MNIKTIKCIWILQEKPVNSKVRVVNVVTAGVNDADNRSDI